MTRKKMTRLPGGKVIKNPYFEDRRNRKRQTRETREKERANRGYPQPRYDNPEPTEIVIEGGYPNSQSQPRPYTGYPVATPHCHYKTCILLLGHEGRHKLRPIGDA